MKAFLRRLPPYITLFMLSAVMVYMEVMFASLREWGFFAVLNVGFVVGGITYWIQATTEDPMFDYLWWLLGGLLVTDILFVPGRRDEMALAFAWGGGFIAWRWCQRVVLPLWHYYRARHEPAPSTPSDAAPPSDPTQD
jgi:hypothetical protein